MIELTRPPCPNTGALKTNYKDPINKDALRTASSDKCMYCESRISVVYFGDIEHIKPKSKFPTDEFKWDNLGYVCAKCNNAKNDKWEASTPFVNPYEEDPSDHLVAIGAWIYQKHGSERGEYTWKELDLNRIELIGRRVEAIERVRILLDKIERTKSVSIIKTMRSEILSLFDDQNEYALVIRAALKQLS